MGINLWGDLIFGFQFTFKRIRHLIWSWLKGFNFNFNLTSNYPCLLHSWGLRLLQGDLRLFLHWYVMKKMKNLMRRTFYWMEKSNETIHWIDLDYFLFIDCFSLSFFDFQFDFNLFVFTLNLPITQSSVSFKLAFCDFPYLHSLETYFNLKNSESDLFMLFIKFENLFLY